MRRTFKAFSYRDFRLMWAGAFTSSVGTWMQEVAQNWLILTMTGSTFAAGPRRVPRRRAVPALLALRRRARGPHGPPPDPARLAGRPDGERVPARGPHPHRHVQVWIILTLSFVVGFAQSFGGPAYQALVPTLVDKEDLPNAVALNSIQFNLARVIGPVLAGVAFYKLGAAACFGLNALSFLAPIAALLVLTRGGSRGAGHGDGAPEPRRRA